MRMRVRTGFFFFFFGFPFVPLFLIILLFHSMWFRSEALLYFRFDFRFTCSKAVNHRDQWPKPIRSDRPILKQLVQFWWVSFRIEAINGPPS